MSAHVSRGAGETLARALAAGDERALARAITLAEESPECAAELLALLGPSRHVHVLAVTGPPGAGKSTLVDCLIPRLRAEGSRIGVVAVDPSSPFTGGSVLGDRLRMVRAAVDQGVFIRSLSTRGARGGLSRATGQVIRLMGAFGMDRVLVETVGVGQTELDVLTIADTVVVVLVPEAGDAIQAMKAGLLEAADVLVVNKADRPGAANLASTLEATLRLRTARDGWNPPVVKTCATEDAGLTELLAAVNSHAVHLAAGELEERGARQRRAQLMATMQERIVLDLEAAADSDEEVAAWIRRAEEGTVDPWFAAAELLRWWRTGPTGGSSGSLGGHGAARRTATIEATER